MSNAANLQFGNLQTTNLHTDEMFYYRNLTKIDTDENKAIHIIPQFCLSLHAQLP